jgi:hypothetical protein
MDDSQLERELAALAGEQAETEQTSEAETKTPAEGEEGQAETETEEQAEAEDESDAGDDASEAEDEDGEEEAEEDEKPKPAARKKSGVQRLKEQLAAARAEAAALRSRASDSEPTQADVEKLIGKPPKEEDFKGDFLAFERAQTVYEMRKANAEDRLRDRATEASAAAQQRARELLEEHRERERDFRKKVPEYDKAAKALESSGIQLKPELAEMIVSSEKSPHLVLYFERNRDRLTELNEMSPVQMGRAFGRIEARLSLPQPKTQTKAPPPKAPPKGGASPSSPDKELDGWLKKTYG